MLSTPRPSPRGVMTKAWAAARAGAKRFGGVARQYLALALRQAWAAEWAALARVAAMRERVLAEVGRIRAEASPLSVARRRRRGAEFAETTRAHRAEMDARAAAYRAKWGPAPARPRPRPRPRPGPGPGPGARGRRPRGRRLREGRIVEHRPAAFAPAPELATRAAPAELRPLLARLEFADANLRSLEELGRLRGSNAIETVARQTARLLAQVRESLVADRLEVTPAGLAALAEGKAARG